MNRHERYISLKTKAEIATSTALVATLGALLIFGGKNHDTTPDSGQPQRDPKAPAGRAGQGTEQEHHPLPWYESDKGPDGQIDFYAHKHTQDGVTSYRIDGGTPAPAPAPTPAPEHREHPEK